jgi:hypothetical protein
MVYNKRSIFILVHINISTLKGVIILVVPWSLELQDGIYDKIPWKLVFIGISLMSHQQYNWSKINCQGK